MRILYVIAEKKFFHYGEIRHEMTDTTDTLLAEMFKELPADGVIDRKQCKKILSHLEYSLTNKDVSLIPVPEKICQWSGTNHKTVANLPCLITRNAITYSGKR